MRRIAVMPKFALESGDQMRPPCELNRRGTSLLGSVRLRGSHRNARCFILTGRPPPDAH